MKSFLGIVKDRLVWQLEQLSETSTCSSIVAKWHLPRRTKRTCAFWSTGRILRICRRCRQKSRLKKLSKTEHTTSYYFIFLFNKNIIYFFLLKRDRTKFEIIFLDCLACVSSFCPESFDQGSLLDL